MGPTTTANVAAKQAPRLVCDRELKQWLVQSVESPGQFSKLEFVSQTGGLESLGDAEPLVLSVTDRYVDRDFQFGATGVSWR